MTEEELHKAIKESELPPPFMVSASRFIDGS